MLAGLGEIQHRLLNIWLLLAVVAVVMSIRAAVVAAVLEDI
jgi:hypothetical protein